MKGPRLNNVIVLVLVFLCLMILPALAENVDLNGEWVYKDDPETTLMTLNANGTALYAGTDLTWQISEGCIRLTDAENASFDLPFEMTGDVLTVWLPTQYSRISEIGAAGELLGTWKALGESGSSFIFTQEKRFLEDGVFTGNYVDDPEQGRVTLQYVQGMFADTTILYSFDGDLLAVGYPWKLIRK